MTKNNIIENCAGIVGDTSYVNIVADTYSNQILVFQNQKRLKISKILVSKRIEHLFNMKFHFKIFKDKVAVYDFSLLRGNHYHSLSHAK